MSEHAAFVDLEPIVPGERLVDSVLDFGRLVEALVFYDRVYVSAPREEPFSSLCRRLKTDGDLANFIALLQNGEVVIVDYDFYTLIQGLRPGSGAVKGAHLIDSLAAAGKSFEQRSLGYPKLQSILSGSERVKLRRAALRHLFLIRLGNRAAILTEDANRDYASSTTVSALLAELADAAGAALPEGSLVRSVETDDEGFIRVEWTVDFEQLDQEARRATGLTGPVIRPTDPLGAALGRDRLLWSAQVTGSDLHVSQPMESLVISKLREAGSFAKSVQDIITPITEEAEFPDIRSESNCGLVGLGDALRFREKAKGFRRWLHEERTHDRNAVSAYLGAFSKDSGMTKAAKKLLTISAVAVGGAAGAAIAGPIGAANGALVGGAAGAVAKTLISDLAARLTGTWRPMVFGSWLKREIKRRQLGS